MLEIEGDKSQYSITRIFHHSNAQFPMFSTSYIEINKSALEHNIRYLKKRIGEKTIFSSVIKGNAYGHGIEHFLPLVEKCGVNHFSVFDADEARRAEKCKSPESRIMIMGSIDNDQIEWAVEHDISFFVFQMDRLKTAVKASEKLGKKARIHIHLETGFHRFGFEEDQLGEVVELIGKNRNQLVPEGVCTHYAGAESISNHVRVKGQIARFNENVMRLKRQGIGPGLRHTACSAAVFNYPETIMDMVRVGIAQYGLWPNQETRIRILKNRINGNGGKVKGIEDPLKRIISWKSKVMNIKDVDAGEFVGYGTAYLTTRPERLAGIPVGYAHGFSRSLSNIGQVLIKGHRARVVGNVNMNAMMVDITDIPDVKPGDEVVMIGKQGEDEVTLSSFSEMSNYLNYELLTRLPNGIPRLIL